MMTLHNVTTLTAAGVKKMQSENLKWAQGRDYPIIPVVFYSFHNCEIQLFVFFITYEI